MQRINEHRMSAAKSLSKSTLVNDMAKTIVIDPHDPTLHHVVYGDNINAVALEDDRVANVMAELESLFTVGASPFVRSPAVLANKKYLYSPIKDESEVHKTIRATTNKLIAKRMNTSIHVRKCTDYVCLLM